MMRDYQTVVKVVPLDDIPNNFNVLSFISKSEVLVINADYEEFVLTSSSETINSEVSAQR